MRFLEYNFSGFTFPTNVNLISTLDSPWASITVLLHNMSPCLAQLRLGKYGSKFQNFAFFFSATYTDTHTTFLAQTFTNIGLLRPLSSHT